MSTTASPPYPFSWHEVCASDHLDESSINTKSVCACMQTTLISNISKIELHVTIADIFVDCSQRSVDDVLGPAERNIQIKMQLCYLLIVAVVVMIGLLDCFD